MTGQGKLLGKRGSDSTKRDFLFLLPSSLLRDSPCIVPALPTFVSPVVPTKQGWTEERRNVGRRNEITFLSVFLSVLPHIYLTFSSEG